MTSDRPRHLSSAPAWTPASSDSGERPSVTLPSVTGQIATEQWDHVQRLRAKPLADCDRELDLVAPRMRKIEMTHDQLAKARARAALEAMVWDAGSNRRLADLAELKEKTIRDWLEIDQRVVALHLLFRVPDHLALIAISHLVRRWGSRAVRELRALCDELLGEADDGPRARAS